ncbi:hypothetical protein SAY86_017043 [Trapa natans]|uniref:FAF domain-containing protein n=1 Tax=Trapa natans TaxID=22666 RepID=A0AAN7R2C9_TRANT|nr:hypothetical protein SAY86_017043 [Trapa natans]
MSTVMLQSPTQHSEESMFMEQPKLELPVKPTSGFSVFDPKVEAFPSESRENPAISHIPKGPLTSSYFFSSALSEISLELCTENLGNETGCIETDETRLSLLSSDSPPLCPDRCRSSSRRNIAEKKRAVPRTFPPPLTIISGRDAIQFYPHRENGRLVIEAVRAMPFHGGLQADRSHGRFRLRFVEKTDHSYEEDVEGDGLCSEEEVAMAEEGEEGDDWLGEDGGDADEDTENPEGRMENAEVFARTGGRCTAGGKAKSKSGSLDWGPCLVASS